MQEKDFLLETPPPTGLSFGERARALRRARQLTLQQLSDQSGLAISTLSKIENGQMSPTYETLLRLAAGLAVEVEQLFRQRPSGYGSARRSVTRKGQGARLQTPHYEYEMLAAEIAPKQLVPLVTLVRAHDVAAFSDLHRHEGEEFIYVLRGSVVLHTASYAPLPLEEGDSCYFDSSMGHACISAGAEDATILWVCSGVGRVGSA